MSKIDLLLQIVGYVFDLNYPISYAILKKEELLHPYYELMKQNKEIKELIPIIEAYLKKKEGSLC